MILMVEALMVMVPQKGGRSCTCLVGVRGLACVGLYFVNPVGGFPYMFGLQTRPDLSWLAKIGFTDSTDILCILQ